MREYFEALGDLIAFWRVKSSWSGGRVVVLAEERFTIQPCDLIAASELALIFDLRNGLITRLLVVEDPPAPNLGSPADPSASAPSSRTGIRQARRTWAGPVRA